jgi:integrase
MARPKHKLSTKFVEKNGLRPGLYGDGAGLYLQVSSSKTKAWVFRYMLAGRARKMGLGDIDRIGLAEARKKAAEASSLIVDGKDPINERKARKAALAIEKAKALSFKECAEQYITMQEPGWKNPKSPNQWRASLKAYAYPTIGNLAVAEIDKALILKILEPIWTTKTVTATRVRGRIESILDWARAFDLRQGDNPAAWSGHLEHLLPAPSQVAPVKHHAALPYADLPGFMAKLRAKEGVSARALEFTILCAVRTGDTIGAKWSEVDASHRLWTVPGARLKGEKGAGKRDHLIPLSRRACEILLEELPKEGDFIFPGGKEGAGLSNAAMSELLKGMGYSGDAATVRGFRSTFMDWGHETTAYPKEMMDIALAHTVADKVEAAYRRGDMREKRRRLMEDWSAYCAGKEVGGSNVVKIGARK